MLPRYAIILSRTYMKRPRINGQIPAQEVRVIDDLGSNLGNFPAVSFAKSDPGLRLPVWTLELRPIPIPRGQSNQRKGPFGQNAVRLRCILKGTTANRM